MRDKLQLPIANLLGLCPRQSGTSAKQGKQKQSGKAEDRHGVVVFNTGCSGPCCVILQEDYLEVERERFSDRMSFTVDASEEVRRALVR